jgi:membrane-associated phospholipid phosphatase
MLTQKRTLLLNIGFLLAFLLVTVFRPSFHSIDVAVNLWTPTIQSPILTFFAEGIAIVFDTTSLVIISIIISGILFLKNRKLEGLFLLGAMGGDALIVSILKALDHVARPANAIVTDTGFSYPSGHSAGVVVFMGVLAYFAWRHWRSTRARVAIGVSLGVLIGVVGFDRIYLNVHWLSDVFGGWLFGAFWLAFVILLFVLFERTFCFESKRFNIVANWLYVVAVVVAVLVALSGYIL